MEWKDCKMHLMSLSSGDESDKQQGTLALWKGK